MHRTRPHIRRRPRRLLAAGAALMVAGAVAVTTPTFAGAAGTGDGIGTGGAGQTLTVTPVDDLDPAGETVTVTGTGFDAAAGFDTVTEGLYVAFCVDKGAGEAPSPCVGGIDMTGGSGSSRWVTNNPYSGTPSVPITAQGSFSTTIVVQQADELIDCADLPAGQECKVVVRVDHRAGADRSQDVKVPVTFGDGVPDGPTLAVDPATDIDPDGQDLTVTGTGFPTDGPGLYVVYGPEPEDDLDASMYGAQAFVPAGDLDDDGGFEVVLEDVAAAYTDDDDVAHDHSDGGGFVSTIRAHGTPDPTGAWRTSTPVAFAGATVPVAETTTTLEMSSTTVEAGKPVTVTGIVRTVEPTARTTAAPRAAVTTGTVEFLDGTTSLGTASLTDAGWATRNVTFATAGTRSVTARFTGTTTAEASTSAAVSVVVTPAADPDPDQDPDPDPDPDSTPSGSRTGTGVAGQTLTATPVDNLDPNGTAVEVTGTGFASAAGFDVDVDGLYVSFCVDKGAGVQPSPCVGGVDMEGESGSSKWVTNNPYQGAPSVAIAADGSFTTTITVMARDEFVDCLDLPAGQRCVIVARTDHRATADRSQDVKVPVCFAGEAACAVDPIDPSADPVDPPFAGYPVGGGGSSTPGGSSSTPTASTGGLAATGFAGRTLVPAGLVLLAGGAALLVVARRPVRLRPAAAVVRTDRSA